MVQRLEIITGKYYVGHPSDQSHILAGVPKSLVGIYFYSYLRKSNDNLKLVAAGISLHVSSSSFKKRRKVNHFASVVEYQKHFDI